MTGKDPVRQVTLTLDELSILLGALHEAIFEFGDDEFRTRVGWSAEVARALAARLADIRRDMKAR